MKVSLVALFAAVAAAAPNLAGRNVPDSCDKQLQQCKGLANADGAVCDSRQKICLANCENGFESCDSAAATDKKQCWSVYEACAGHPRPPSS